jgi:hypothetical protein
MRTLESTKIQSFVTFYKFYGPRDRFCCEWQSNLQVAQRISVTTSNSKSAHLKMVLWKAETCSGECKKNNKIVAC